MPDEYPELFKKYRIAEGITQAQLAERLQVGQSYVSKIESGARVPQNRDFFERFHQLLEETPTVDQASLQRYSPIEELSALVRLAKSIRDAGRPAEAARELHSFLTATSEKRYLEDTNAVKIRSEAKIHLGIALGDLLSEQQQSLATSQVESGVRDLSEISDENPSGELLTRYGNELRKAGDLASAAELLDSVVTRAENSDLVRGKASLALARVRMLQGQERDFFRTVDLSEKMLSELGFEDATFNLASLFEVRLRGQTSFNRVLGRHIDTEGKHSIFGVAPQWLAIKEITISEALFKLGEKEQAAVHLRSGILGAIICNLPKQVSRAARTLRIHGENPDLLEEINMFHAQHELTASHKLAV